MEAKKRVDSASHQRWWVVQQHDEISVLQASERPNTEPVKGERARSAFGPFRAKDAAESRANDMRTMTWAYRAQNGGE